MISSERRQDVDAVAAENARTGAGSVGVVVGATLADPPDLSALGGPVLAPGVGAQGGRVDDLGRLGAMVLPAVSREILRAGPDIGALRAAAQGLRDQIAGLS